MAVDPAAMFPVWSESGQVGWEFRPEQVSHAGAAPEPYEVGGSTVREDSADMAERKLSYRLNAECCARTCPISSEW